MNNLKKIPNHWKWVTLDDIGIIVSGGTPSTKEPDFWNGDIAWVTPADLSGHEEVFVSKGSRNISQAGLDYSSAYLLPANSVIFSSRAPIGYVAITKNKLATNQGFKNLVLPSNLVNAKYVYYYLKTIKELAENMASGTTFLELSATKFRQIPFPLAPVEEQNRIVEKIEELISTFDNLRDTILENKDKLEKYKQLLIHKVFSDNFKRNVFRKKYRLSEIYSFIGGGTPSKKNPDYWGDGYYWASVKDINRTFIFDTIDKITEEGIRNSSTNIAENNEVILVTRINPGKVAVAKTDIAVNQDLKIVRLKGVKVYYLYTYYLFRYLEKSIIEISKGTTVKGIRLDELNEIEVDIPDYETQIEIVEKLENQIYQNDLLIKNLNQELEKINILTQKILREAFLGKLINQINTDTSIEILLKSIKKGKEQYILNQQEIIKNCPKTKRMQKEKLSIIQVLEKSKKPISSKQLWKDSMYSDNIEKFYSELKKVQDKIIEEKTEKGSLISLK